MGLELATFIGELVPANPLFNDGKVQGDDHLRLLKTTLQNTFPGLLGAVFRVQSKSSSYTVIVSDNLTVIKATSPITLNLTAAATLGNKHLFIVDANGGAVTIDPNGSEPVNGVSTFVIDSGNVGIVWCDGSAFYCAILGKQSLIAPPFNAATPILRDSLDGSKQLKFLTAGLPTATTRNLTLPSLDGVIALLSDIVTPSALPFPAMWIQGLVPANNFIDPIDDIDVSAGQCRDATDTHNIVLPAITKRLDATWAVGTNQGGLDTGSLTNSDYFIWAIKRSDTAVSDVLLSLSATAPVMPTNYDFKRLIGWFRRAAGVIKLFTALETAGGGLDNLWVTLPVDVNETPGITAILRVVSVPVGLKVQAKLNVHLSNFSNQQPFVYISCPDVTDQAATQNTTSPIASIGISTDSPGDSVAEQVEVRTNALAQIRIRSAVTATLIGVATVGWEWSRR